uniref:Uncharacterized protein n=1 Tax=Marseillevirus LCMAC201 TaxID=2506605 RepID=A0A481YVM2_9VIRU|nr:MAG: hypothetical protein LCMAC201_02530 [Marseillevirus LCMAC201]
MTDFQGTILDLLLGSESTKQSFDDIVSSVDPVNIELTFDEFIEFHNGCYSMYPLETAIFMAKYGKEEELEYEAYSKTEGAKAIEEKKEEEKKSLAAYRLMNPDPPNLFLQMSEFEKMLYKDPTVRRV